MTGVNSFVLFLAGKGYQLTDDELYESMKRCRDLGGLAMVHAENSHIINAVRCLCSTKLAMLQLCHLLSNGDK